MAAVATLVAALGVAGIVRGAMPQPISRGSYEPASSRPTVVAGPAGSGSSATSAHRQAPKITITGAYVRQPPWPNGPAVAYLTINNTSGFGDTLLSVESADAGEVRLQVGASRTPLLSGVEIPGHSSVRLGAGTTHILIEDPYGPLRHGSTQNLVLWFDAAGAIVVPAPVLPATAPTPTVAITN